MTFPFLINIIAAGLLRYLIPLLRSCPRKIRLELHPGARATLYNSILSSSVSDTKTILIFSVWMTCLADVTKSLLLALVLLKRLRLLHKWRDTHESKNQVLELVLVFWNYGFFATINIVATRPGTKTSRSDSLLLLLLDTT